MTLSLEAALAIADNYPCNDVWRVLANGVRQHQKNLEPAIARCKALEGQLENARSQKEFGWYHKGTHSFSHSHYDRGQQIALFTRPVPAPDPSEEFIETADTHLAQVEASLAATDMAFSGALARCSALEAALAESRNNDRIAMSWIADIKKTVRGEDMDLPALLRHLQTLMAHVQEWLCPVCNTVHLPPKGFNLSCPTPKCKGTLRPSSLAIRRVEDQRDGLLAAMKEIKETLSRHRRFGEGHGAMHPLVGAEEAAETAISKAGVPS